MNKGHLESIYDAIQEKRKDRDSHIDIVTKLDSQIQQELLEYRINSVIRVLDFLHSESFKNGKLLKEYGNIITHCCNKLSGNIDGIELSLGDDK